MARKKKIYMTAAQLKETAFQYATEKQSEKLQQLMDAPAMDWKITQIVHSVVDDSIVAIFVKSETTFAMIAPSGKLSRPTKGKKTIQYDSRTCERSFY